MTFLGKIPYSKGTLVNINVITSNTTWTKPDWFTADSYIVVEVIGAGGAGGGVGSTASGEGGGSGGGGGGGYALKLLKNSDLNNTETATVGLGGAGVAGELATGDGNDGGTSSFTTKGLTVQATGGFGAKGGNQVPNFTSRPAGDGGIGSNGDINLNGLPGSLGMGIGSTTGATPLGNGGGGGSTLYGGAPKPLTTNGAYQYSNAYSYGTGGTGVCKGQSQAGNVQGGNGADGVIVVWEFA